MTEDEKLLEKVRQLVREARTPTSLGMNVELLFPDEVEARKQATQ